MKVRREGIKKGEPIWLQNLTTKLCPHRENERERGESEGLRERERERDERRKERSDEGSALPPVNVEVEEGLHSCQWRVESSEEGVWKWSWPC